MTDRVILKQSVEKLDYAYILLRTFVYFVAIKSVKNLLNLVGATLLCTIVKYENSIIYFTNN